MTSKTPSRSVATATQSKDTVGASHRNYSMQRKELIAQLVTLLKENFCAGKTRPRKSWKDGPHKKISAMDFFFGWMLHGSSMSGQS